MADRLAENGAIQYALANPEAGSKRAALSGYIMGALNDWLRNPFPPSSRLAAPGRLRGKFFDSGLAPLAMDFTSGQYASGSAGTMAMKSFSDIVTFSRTSNATITKSDGTIVYAPHNLLTYSEQFDNAVWTKANGTSASPVVTANTVIAPNALQTADTIVFGAIDAAGDFSVISQVLTLPATQDYTRSVYVKATSVSDVGKLLYFYVTDGVLKDVVTVTLTAEWQRVTKALSMAAGAAKSFTIGTLGSTYGGANQASVSADLWGFQVEIGSSATTYNPTTVKNLLGYTEAFDNAAWTKSNSFVQTNLVPYSEAFDNAAWSKFNGTSTNPIVTANAVLAPNGYQTADTVAFGAIDAAGDYSVISQNITLPATQDYTRSIYVKATTADDVGKLLYFYVVDGVLKDVVTVTLTAEWQRVTKALSMAAGAAKSFTIGTLGSSLGGANQAAVSADLWGFQVVQGSVAGDYRRTDAAALPVFYANHNGVVCAEQLHGTAANGTILESYTATGGSMTFSIWLRRITGTGNVDITMDTGSTWTTQAITTDWVRYSITTSPTAGARTAGVRLVTSGDIIQVFGAMVSDSASLDPYVLNAAAAPSAQAYYGARFDYDPVTLEAKGLLIEEQRSNLLLNSSLLGTVLGTQIVTVTAVAHTLSFYGTGTVTISGTYTGSLVGSGAYPTRSTLTFTPTAGAITLTVTGTVQFAQLEIGAFATSYIPTAASAVTRAADVAVIQGSNFYSWYNQNANSLYARFDSPAIGNRNIIAVDDGSANNHIKLRTEGTDPYIRSAYVGSEVVALDLGTVAANTAYKIAVGYSINDYAGVINAGTVGTDTNATTPIASVMRLGTDQAGAYLNGHLYAISSYNSNLPASTLSGITA